MLPAIADRLQFPVFILIQIFKIRVHIKGPVDAGHICLIAVGKKLPVYHASADNEHIILITVL